MRISYLIRFAVILVMLSASLALAQNDIKWEAITEKSEVKKLVSGNALVAKHWVFYFRRDGKLGSKVYDSISVREWTITDGGELCYSVLDMPDQIIRCEVVKKTTKPPVKYRVIGDIGKFEFEVEAPPSELVDAIIDRAGPE